MMPISEVYLISGEKMCKLNKQLVYPEKFIDKNHSKEACEEKDNLFQTVYKL